MSLSENIKKYRKAKKITQKTLGEKIGRSEVTIQKYEAKKNPIEPPFNIIQQIAEVLEVSVNDLIDTSEATRAEFEGDFDLSVFDTRVMKYIDDYKNTFKSLYPGLKIDNTLVIQNLIIDIMANEHAKKSSGMDRQTVLYQFPVLDKEMLTGEKLYNILYDNYFKKYNLEYKQGLEKKAKLIIEAYKDNYKNLDGRGISILKEYFENVAKEDIPEDIFELLEEIE